MKEIRHNSNCQCAWCKAKRGEYKDNKNPNWKGGKPKCKICGKELSYYGYKYCKKHKMMGYIGKKRPEHSKRMKGKNHPNYKTGKYCSLIYCKVCNKVITLGSKTSLCKSCSHYKGSIKDRKYLGFTKSLRNTIRKRDRYRCQLCNIKEPIKISNISIKLDIHHIDYNKNNYKENNLISLCHGCHTKTNYNRDYWYAYFKYIMEN